MFSYSQIARWLTFPLDPVTVEDWVANREIFGPFASAQGKPSEEEKQLETAYQVEMAKMGRTLAERKDLPLLILLNGLEASGLVDEKDYLIVAPVGKVPGKPQKVVEVELRLEGAKPQKITVVSGDIFVLSLSGKQQARMVIKCAGGWRIKEKGKIGWSGAGKTKIIIDGRGRPLPNYQPGREQREHMAKLRQLL